MLYLGHLPDVPNYLCIIFFPTLKPYTFTSQASTFYYTIIYIKGNIYLTLRSEHTIMIITSERHLYLF